VLTILATETETVLQSRRGPAPADILPNHVRSMCNAFCNTAITSFSMRSGELQQLGRQ
jgi:hypothetical protein